MAPLRFLRRASRRFLREESGMTAVEYAVLAAFVLLICMVAIVALKEPTGSAFESSATSIGTYADP
jgi:Flp pilus assembly pilin Flp